MVATTFEDVQTILNTVFDPTNNAIATTSGTASTVKSAVISTSTSGASDVVALVTGKKIRVLGYAVVAAGAVNVKFQTGVSADKTGAMALAANGGVVSGYCSVGWFETVAGEALKINLSSAVAVAGHVLYSEI